MTLRISGGSSFKDSESPITRSSWEQGDVTERVLREVTVALRSEKLGDSCTKTWRALLRGMASPGGGCGPESRRPAWLELTEQGAGA